MANTKIRSEFLNIKDGAITVDMLENDAKDESIRVTIDGQGSTITTGELTAEWEAPHDGTIINNSLTADQSGSIVIDVWKDTYANYPPTDADSITSSDPPTISSAQKSEDISLVGWTTSFSK